MAVEFHDFNINVKTAMSERAIAWLYEAAGEIESQTKRNTRVDTGQTKNSWDYRVDESNLEATVGSPLENALWEEFGTGEYALHGDGRKGGWNYKDKKGEWHHTFGKRPNRAFYRAFTSLKHALIRSAEEYMKGLDS